MGSDRGWHVNLYGDPQIQLISRNGGVVLIEQISSDTWRHFSCVILSDFLLQMYHIRLLISASVSTCRVALLCSQ